MAITILVLIITASIMSNQIMTHAIKEPMSENPIWIVIAVNLTMMNAIKKPTTATEFE